jgi:hypothetical protein
MTVIYLFDVQNIEVFYVFNTDRSMFLVNYYTSLDFGILVIIYLICNMACGHDEKTRSGLRVLKGCTCLLQSHFKLVKVSKHPLSGTLCRTFLGK